MVESRDIENELGTYPGQSKEKQYILLLEQADLEPSGISDLYGPSDCYVYLMTHFQNMRIYHSHNLVYHDTYKCVKKIIFFLSSLVSRLRGTTPEKLHRRVLLPLGPNKDDKCNAKYDLGF